MYNQLKSFHVRYTHFLQPAWRVQSGILPCDHTWKQINTSNVLVLVLLNSHLSKSRIICSNIENISMLQSRNLFGGKSKYFLSKSKYFWMLTKVLIPAVLRSEWMFSCSCERCSDPAQADMGTHMSSFSCGCGGFYTARQTCRRCATKFGTENTILREDRVLKVMAFSNICS